MLDRLKSIFKTHDTIDSLSVFPEINDVKIARELRLEELGKERGSRNQPSANCTDFDHVETSIIGRIEALRRTGLENYENNRRTYNERLARAGEARKEVGIVAGRAKGDFLAAVQSWKSTMTSSIERLGETYQHRTEFRAQYGLKRPAKQFEGWWKFSMLSIIFVSVESGLNAFMFSKNNEQGLLGGLLTAVIFSALNVVVSTLMGLFSSELNHTNYLRKLCGFVAVVVWFGLASLFNFMIGHFRDVISLGEVAWDEAVRQVVPRMANSLIGLENMDSWILLGIGMTISILAFMKGWHAKDPFPGYAQVEHDLDQARRSYESDFASAIHDLTENRDLAIEHLRDADTQVREGISQAIDALFGQSALNSHLQNFLEQCDVKLAHLLATYRDANKVARSEPSPKSFSLPYKFAQFKPTKFEDGRKKTAEAEADKVSELVFNTIEDLFSTFKAAILEFQLPEEIQKGDHLSLKVAENGK
ncbi:MAG: hypothetical protein IT544_06935 [Rhodobacteraceae bacterium]|nr:hypothetical protein [Paracoccaceae bacterium]